MFPTSNNVGTNLAMYATVVCIIFLTAIVIDMETIIALRYRACSTCNIASSRNGVFCKCIAVLAICPAVGVIIFADQRLAGIFGLIADIPLAQFSANAVCTNLLLIAGLADAAVNPACRVVLGTSTLPRQRIQTITRLALFDFTSCIFTHARLPSSNSSAIDFRCTTICN